MSKTLQVIEPFLTLEVGDKFELTEDGKQYIHTENETFSSADVEGDDVTSAYTSSFSISIPYAKCLIDQGFLSEETETKSFVNIFDEIDRLLYTYSKELSEINTNNMPKCVAVEKETVLENMIKLLNYLKDLKK